MNIKKCNSKKRPYIRREGRVMENVLKIDDYKVNIEEEKYECEWDIMGSIFQKAIKRKGMNKSKVSEISKKMLKEVRHK